MHSRSRPKRATRAPSAAASPAASTASALHPWCVSAAGLLLAAATGAVAAATPRDGVLDPSFGSAGVARFAAFDGGNIEARLLHRIVPLPDGGALLLGAGSRPGTFEPLLPLVVRIDRFGAADPGFATGGAYLLPELPGVDDTGARAFGAAVLADGRIVVVSAVPRGFFPTAFASFDDCAWVFALTPAGTLVEGYGPDAGPGCVDFGDSSNVTYLDFPPVGSITAVDAQGRVLLGGRPHDLPGSGESALARLGPDGRLDAAFGAQGRLRYGADRFVLPSTSPGFVAGPQVLLAPAAGAGGRTGLLRFSADGVVDANYGDQGFAGTAWTTMQDAWNFIGGIALDRQGRALVAGYSRTFSGGGVTTCDACVTRFLPDGSLDLTFNAAGTWPGAPGSALIVAVPQGAAAALSVLARGDGRVLLAGTSGGPPGEERLLVLALREDAAPETRFGPESTPGRVQLSLAPGAGGTIFGDAVLANDGGVLLGGWLGIAGGGIAVARLVDDLVFGDSFEDAGASE